MKSRFVLIKARVPDYYEGADCAVIEVTEALVLRLDKRIAMTMAMSGEEDFYGTRWWDCSPYFVGSVGPETFGLDVSEETFENALEGCGFLFIPEGYAPGEHSAIDTLILTIDPDGDFQWSGYDKYVGEVARVSTYRVEADSLDEWAELIGCTEMLAKARRYRQNLQRSRIEVRKRS